MAVAEDSLGGSVDTCLAYQVKWPEKKFVVVVQLSLFNGAAVSLFCQKAGTEIKVDEKMQERWSTTQPCLCSQSPKSVQQFN